MDRSVCQRSLCSALVLFIFFSFRRVKRKLGAKSPSGSSFSSAIGQIAALATDFRRNRNGQCLTSSTWRNTRKKLSPANFLRSSSVHLGSWSNSANRCGYLETSSNPCGALRNAEEEEKDQMEAGIFLHPECQRFQPKVADVVD